MVYNKSLFVFFAYHGFLFFIISSFFVPPGCRRSYTLPLRRTFPAQPAPRNLLHGETDKTPEQGDCESLLHQLC